MQERQSQCGRCVMSLAHMRLLLRTPTRPHLLLPWPHAQRGRGQGKPHLQQGSAPCVGVGVGVGVCGRVHEPSRRHFLPVGREGLASSSSSTRHRRAHAPPSSTGYGLPQEGAQPRSHAERKTRGGGPYLLRVGEVELARHLGAAGRRHRDERHARRLHPRLAPRGGALCGVCVCACLGLCRSACLQCRCCSLSQRRSPSTGPASSNDLKKKSTHKKKKKRKSPSAADQAYDRLAQVHCGAGKLSGQAREAAWAGQSQTGSEQAQGGRAQVAESSAQSRQRISMSVAREGQVQCKQGQRRRRGALLLDKKTGLTLCPCRWSLG